MKKIVLSVLVLVVVAIGAWSLGHKAEPVESASAASAPAARPGANTVAALPPSSVLAIDPKQINLGATWHAVRSQQSPLARDFANATQYKLLYDRLKNLPEGQTPEGQYFLYQVLRACASIAGAKGGTPSATNSARLEQRKQELIATLPETDPRRSQRIAAFDKLSADKCQGMDGVAVTEADLSQILRNAVSGGDPKAGAFQIEQDMWQAARDARAAGGGGRNLTLSDPQLDGIRNALGSRDPEAMVIAGRVLANSFRDIAVTVGPNQDAIEARVFNNATQLVACDYGYACADNNQRVLNACAYQGHCGVTTLNDYLFYYGSSPYDSQLLDQYGNTLRQAVHTGDFSQLNIQRGTPATAATAPNPPGGRYVIGGGPPPR